AAVRARRAGRTAPRGVLAGTADRVVGSLGHPRRTFGRPLVPGLGVADAVGAVGWLERPVHGAVGDLEEERPARALLDEGHGPLGDQVCHVPLAPDGPIALVEVGRAGDLAVAVMVDVRAQEAEEFVEPMRDR